METVESSPPPEKVSISNEETHSGIPSTKQSRSLEDSSPWLGQALQEVLIYKNTIQETLDASVTAAKSRFSEIRSTSSAHFHQTIGSLQDVNAELAVYEEKLFGHLKQGVDVAAAHPFITSGVAVGLGLIALKRTRRFLYYNTRRLFVSEESLLSQAKTKVQELHQSASQLKAEKEKLEKTATLAEEVLIRGRNKLRLAGKQIQGVIKSGYKIERQAAGLRDILGDLPSKEASIFRSQVKKVASEAKQERNVLSKEVNKISNYGIPV